MLDWFRNSARAAAVGTLALAISSLAGCGSGGTGVVAGKVTVGGQPLKEGLVTFSSEVGNRDVYNAAIRDGEYRTDPIPCGLAKITVYPPYPGPRMTAEEKAGGDRVRTGPPKGRGGKDEGPVVDPKYGNTETSGLSYTVKPGEQRHDVELP
jgi:hypothetical protein